MQSIYSRSWPFVEASEKFASFSGIQYCLIYSFSFSFILFYVFLYSFYFSIYVIYVFIYFINLFFCLFIYLFIYLLIKFITAITVKRKKIIYVFTCLCSGSVELYVYLLYLLFVCLLLVDLC